MTQRYEYIIKEISNGWIVTIDLNGENSDITHQFFADKTNALEYVIKLLGDMVDAT